MAENKKYTIGLVSGIVSFILSLGAYASFAIFLIATIFASMGLSAYPEGSEQFLAQLRIIQRYQAITIVSFIGGFLLFALGIVLIVVFAKKKAKLKKERLKWGE